MPQEAEKSHQTPSSGALRRRVRDARNTWQTSPERYSGLAKKLPTLIADTERTERRGEKESGEYREVQCCAADLYGLLRTVCKRVGRVDLSLLVADRAVRAAESAEDPYRQAAAYWNLAHVLLAEGRAEGAECVAMQAAHRLQPLRVAFLLDQAKGHVQRREYASSLLLLQAAARTAPEDVAYRPAAHQLLHTVIQQGRRTVAGEAAQLAKSAGLLIS